MKFDTSGVDVTEDFSAKLSLYVAGTDGGEYRTVKISRVDGDFDEHEVTWETYDSAVTDEHVMFDVHRDHVGSAGQIEIGGLMKAGEDFLTVAIHVVEGGHVQLASREHPFSSRSPRLLVSMIDSTEF